MEFILIINSVYIRSINTGFISLNFEGLNAPSMSKIDISNNDIEGLI